MANQHSRIKTVVPIKELKRQINKRNIQHLDSITVIPGIGVHSTWSKYKCEKEETCTDTDCKGRILVKFNNGDINGFLLALWAVHWQQKTYILIDHPFRELMKAGNFIECKEEQVCY